VKVSRQDAKVFIEGGSEGIQRRGARVIRKEARGDNIAGMNSVGANIRSLNWRGPEPLQGRSNFDGRRTRRSRRVESPALLFSKNRDVGPTPSPSALRYAAIHPSGLGGEVIVWDTLSGTLHSVKPVAPRIRRSSHRETAQHSISESALSPDSKAFGTLGSKQLTSRRSSCAQLSIPARH
jgi:hypothetical protein